MIKDIMVHLDGTSADERRLAATSSIAILFESHVIGLFLNVLPMVTPAEGDSAGAVMVTDLLEKARQAGNKTEAILVERLSRLNKPVEIRRFDVFQDTIADVAAREARSADVFLDRRPKKNGSLKTSERLVEGVLFGSGRHLFLIGDRTHVNKPCARRLERKSGVVARPGRVIAVSPQGASRHPCGRQRRRSDRGGRAARRRCGHASQPPRNR
jgi:nucleotide-binding universal stress UspA family protein